MHTDGMCSNIPQGKALVSSPLRANTHPTMPDASGKRMFVNVLVVMQRLPQASKGQEAAEAVVDNQPDYAVRLMLGAEAEASYP